MRGSKKLLNRRMVVKNAWLYKFVPNETEMFWHRSGALHCSDDGCFLPSAHHLRADQIDASWAGITQFGHAGAPVSTSFSSCAASLFSLFIKMTWRIDGDWTLNLIMPGYSQGHRLTS
jgi:hypothetical protein